MAFRVMHIVIAAVVLPLSAVSASAQVADERILEGAEVLGDEATQDRVSRALQVMTRALLSMPVGGIAEAVAEIDPESDMADVPRNARVADMVGPAADEMPTRMAGQSRTMMRAMSVLTRQMAVMAPVLRDMASQMAAQVEAEARDPRPRPRAR